ncbi:MAG: DUF2142 domain-containing protein [Anaerolineae bacterium]|nr:DUF2142 domain-containing protein [Anaerolineae bacterium]
MYHLAFLLLLTLLNGLLWSAAIPLWQGTDEDGHFAATQFVAEHLRLPGRDDVYRADELLLAAELADVRKLPYNPHLRQAFGGESDGPYEAELRALDPALRTSYALGAPGKLNHTSPLYYVLGAVAYRLVYGADLLVRVFAVRLFSILLTIGLVGVSYGLAAEAMPDRLGAALTVAAMVSFQPMISFIGSIVNNDILVSLLTTGAIWILVRIWWRGLTVARAIGLGVALGLGMLAKPLIAGLALPAALVLSVAWWRRAGQRTQVVLLGLLSLAVALGLCGWWVVRSLDLNDGELYMDEIKRGYRVIGEPFYDYRGRAGRHAIDYYASIVGGVWGSYWAAFGWLDTPAAPLYYWLIDGVTLFGLAGLGYALYRMLCRHAWRQLGTTFLLLTVVLAPVVMMQVYDYVYWVQNGGGRGLQGRYFFGEMAALLILVLTGWLAVVPDRWQGVVHLLLRLGMIAANVYCLLWVVLPRYYT